MVGQTLELGAVTTVARAHSDLSQVPGVLSTLLTLLLLLLLLLLLFHQLSTHDGTAAMVSEPVRLQSTGLTVITTLR